MPPRIPLPCLSAPIPLPAADRPHSSESFCLKTGSDAIGIGRYRMSPTKVITIKGANELARILAVATVAR